MDILPTPQSTIKSAIIKKPTRKRNKTKGYDFSHCDSRQLGPKSHDHHGLSCPAPARQHFFLPTTVYFEGVL